MAQAKIIIGADGGLRDVMERVETVAHSDVPVLLYGETGSGKEVIALAIHERSDRVGRPFVRVNCGAIPPDLIDSELFGHEPGAFTGATTRRRGWFEQADGGTLLLDEVAELAPSAQVRLLRVLQEHEFSRVGGEKCLRVDVRIIAATHRNLPDLVEAGAFRQDLYYRLAVFPVFIPPLRDRQVDFRALATHFAERAARRFGLRPTAVREADLALLLAYSWPGNIRELAAVMDRAVLLGNGERLMVEAALGFSPPPGAPREPSKEPEPPAPTDIETLDEVARRHIERALTLCHGRIEGPFGVARRLGVNPNTLRARMRRLQITPSAFRRT